MLPMMGFPDDEPEAKSAAPFVGHLKKGHEKAMFGVLAEIEKLTKKHENGFAKYTYASVDQFYEAVRPLCAKFGVRWKARESTRATVAGNTILYHFSIDLHFADGHQYRDYDRITVPMSLTGPQVSGAAKSYAMKAFMRANFFMETGEPDGDDADPEAMNANIPNRDLGAQRRGIYNRRSAANRTEDNLMEAIEKASRLDDLESIMRDRRHEIAALKSTDWSQHARVMAALEERRTALTNDLTKKRVNEGPWPPRVQSAPREVAPPPLPAPAPSQRGRRSLDEIERDLISRARACPTLDALLNLWDAEQGVIATLTGARHIRVKTAFSTRRGEVENRSR